MWRRRTCTVVYTWEQGQLDSRRPTNVMLYAHYNLAEEGPEELRSNGKKRRSQSVECSAYALRFEVSYPQSALLVHIHPCVIRARWMRMGHARVWLPRYTPSPPARRAERQAPALHHIRLCLATRKKVQYRFASTHWSSCASQATPAPYRAAPSAILSISSLHPGLGGQLPSDESCSLSPYLDPFEYSDLLPLSLQILLPLTFIPSITAPRTLSLRKLHTHITNLTTVPFRQLSKKMGV